MKWKKFINLAEAINKRWIPISIFIGLATIFLGAHIPQIRTNSDLLSFFSEKDPIVKEYKSIGEKFLSKTTALIIVESDSIFTLSTLRFIKELEDSIGNLEGVNFTQSIISTLNIKKVGNQVEIAPLIGERIPEERAELQSLKEYVTSNNLYAGNIISKDGKYTCITANLDEQTNSQEIASKIIKLTKKLNHKYKIYYSGLPLVMYFVNHTILKDLFTLVPITAFLVIVVLTIGFRRFSGVFIPLSSVLIAVIWTVGLVVISGKKFSIISNLMPVILISVGSAYSIHIINRFYEDHNLEETLKHSLYSVFLAAMTTLVSFLSFSTSSLVPVREFGYYTAWGVFVSFLLAITLTPILLKIFYTGKPVKEQAVKLSRKLIKPLSSIVVAFEKYLIIAGAILAVVTIAFIPAIRREVNMMEYFKPHTEIKKALRITSERFGGSNPVILSVKGDLRNPDNLLQMLYIQKQLGNSSLFSKTQSILSFLMETNYSFNGFYGIPSTQEEVDNLYFLLEGQKSLRFFITSDKGEATIHVYIPSENTDTLTRGIEEIENLVLRNNLPPENILMEILKIDLENAGITVDSITLTPVSQIDTTILVRDVDDFLFNENLIRRRNEKLAQYLTRAFLRGNFGEIESVLGPENAEYFGSQLEFLVERHRVESFVKLNYENLVAGNQVDSTFRKQIQGDLYQIFEYRNRAPSPDIEIRVTGFPKVLQRLNDKLIMTMVSSLAISLVVIFFIVLLQLRTFTGAVISIIPIILTIILNFGIMEVFQIPLDEATALIFSLAVGIGIDYVIHFNSRLREEVKKGVSLEAAVIETIETSGQAILINAFSVGSGFLALLGAQLIPIGRFGLMVAATMLISAFCALTTLPSLILRFKPRYIQKYSNKEGN